MIGKLANSKFPKILKSKIFLSPNCLIITIRLLINSKYLNIIIDIKIIKNCRNSYNFTILLLPQHGIRNFTLLTHLDLTLIKIYRFMPGNRIDIKNTIFALLIGENARFEGLGKTTNVGDMSTSPSERS